MGKIISIIKRPLGAGILLLALVLILQEVLFRIVFPLPEIENFNRIDYSPLVKEADKQAQKPSHSSFSWISDPDGVEFVNTLNLYGFRDKDWRIEKKRPRVAFLGDSFVEGFMASDKETITAGFQRRATRRGEALEALNFGIGGAGLAAYAQLLRDIVPLFHPDAVMLVLYANDLPCPAYHPRWLNNPLNPNYRNPWIPRFVEVLVRVARREAVPRAWIRPPFQYSSAVPDPANPWTKRAEEFEVFVDPDIAKAMKAGRFNPFITDQPNSYAKQLKKPIEVRESLSRLRDYAQSKGTALWVAYIPVRYQVSDVYLQYASRFSRQLVTTSLMGPEYRLHSESLAEQCKAVGLPFLDLTPILQERERKGIRCYWDYDDHMRGQCYLFLGETLYDWWKASSQEPTKGILEPVPEAP